MIIEGILTTQSADGAMHVSPIGPHVDREQLHWTLKPFKSSHTFANLQAHPQAVFHVVDDGLLMVQSVLGFCNPPHISPPAQFEPSVGWVLTQACRAVPLTIIGWDTSEERAIAQCQAGEWRELQPFWGWNRAAHSLLELAILLSRRHFLDPSIVQAEFEKHRIIIEKTAGDRELQALSLVQSALELPPL
jgi:hypothetical protein